MVVQEVQAELIQLNMREVVVLLVQPRPAEVEEHGFIQADIIQDMEEMVVLLDMQVAADLPAIIQEVAAEVQLATML